MWVSRTGTMCPRPQLGDSAVGGGCAGVQWNRWKASSLAGPAVPAGCGLGPRPLPMGALSGLGFRPARWPWAVAFLHGSRGLQHSVPASRAEAAGPFPTNRRRPHSVPSAVVPGSREVLRPVPSHGGGRSPRLAMGEMSQDLQTCFKTAQWELGHGRWGLLSGLQCTF